MIPHMHTPKHEHRWAWNLQQRQQAYSFTLRMWLKNKNRLAKRIVDGNAMERRYFVYEFQTMDKLVTEAVAQCNVEDDQVEFYESILGVSHAG